LNALIDPTQGTQPEADLRANLDELVREEAQIDRDLAAFDRELRAIRGAPLARVVCDPLPGSRDAHTLVNCLRQEIARETSIPWQAGIIYRDEQEFGNVVIRVNKLISAVKDLAGAMAASNVVQLSQQLDSEVTQYQKNVGTFQQQLQVALDAIDLFNSMVATKAPDKKSSLRTEIWKAQLRANLLKSLKVDTKTALDDAEINQLVSKYAEFMRLQDANVARFGATSLRKFAQRNLSYIEDPRQTKQFRIGANAARLSVEVDLRGQVNDINVAQDMLLDRINEIYDNSQVAEPLPLLITLTNPGNFFVSHNLAVKYTIRRIENFARYSAAHVTSPVAVAAAGTQGIPLPGAASTPASPQPTPAPSATPAAGSPGSTGTLAVEGLFYVHDLYRANVVAAFAYSFLKDQKVVKQPSTQCNPASSNCFSPFLASSDPQMHIIFGVDYYFRPRDTFYDVPGRPEHDQPDNRTPLQQVLQRTGVMGAISATRANNWFLGFFYEPLLGVQFASGLNLGRENRLQSNFTFNTPVDMAGDFPTQEHQVKKLFISAGLDLGLFRKIFGKVIGIGTSTTSTQGK